MTTLSALRNRIAKIDPGGKLEPLCYDLSYNKALGFPAGSSFHVALPYGTPWPDNLPSTHESVLEKAFKDTVLSGGEPVPLSSTRPTNKNYYFIDIAHLIGGVGQFFSEGGPSVAQTIADKINGLETPHGDVIAVVRFLVGRAGNSGGSEAELQKVFADMFWKEDGTPMMTNKKAQLHVGYYGPVFVEPGSADTDIETRALGGVLRLWGDGSNSRGQQREAIHAEIQSIELISNTLGSIDTRDVVKRLMEHQLPSVSWNHAKLVVVNGISLVTGGGNFWDFYQANHHDIIDMQAKVLGDAALAAHAYCDYIWKYLKTTHRTDDKSFSFMADLGEKKPGSGGQWKKGLEAPLFESLQRKPALEEGQGVPVLTVARLGDWFEDMAKLEFPVQFIDAVRDIAINVAFHVNMAKSPEQMVIGSTMIEFLHDTSLVGGGSPQVAEAFKKLGITPAAWASRFARCQAIESAQSSVHITAQKFVEGLEGQDKWAKHVVEPLNDRAKLTGEARWDGLLWPYDLLSAFARFLFNLASSGANNQPGSGIFIILASNKTERNGGWADTTKIPHLKERLRAVIRAQYVGRTGQTVKDILPLVDTHFKVRRILDDRTWQNHCKSLCTDRKLLYIGSDTPYPSYNEEHGVWVEDQKAVSDWYTGFWDECWKRSDPKGQGNTDGDA